ncbi:hypothetical protein [Pedobacter rhizosphaerae]|uniref:Uncharacterized protein n=1 Tax=Pedobacter rhizosphaerae TaxID=390241 RepID=A0A1H9L914_9SPHI|nr:hypothetical protein [Pedobacter rhizosphaerae]SER07788.1 hypothetical protein SAMN04488023_10444 [Pedobacter rhizosphaerae]
MFNFFKKPKTETLAVNTTIPEGTMHKPPIGIDIPENIFIENNRNFQSDEDMTALKKTESNIELLFDFLDMNHEKKGYDDALTNPDAKHLEQNIDTLRNQLERKIRRVKIFYEDFIKEIDFHIDSRARSGFVDVVDELKMKKSIAESHIKKVLDIEEEAKKNIGDSEGIIISYKRGFMNGLSAISHHTILKRF